MSWQLATFGGLGVVLAGGFAWYERSRPPARIVALVAALAALAVASRLVLAPIPNVVGTTDVALLTGYAVGGAPGFAVGALAAPISNLWLGQGPWTPWQMAGWGLAGLAGAALASLTGRRLGRFGLAAACGVAGLAYGALLDLSVMVTYGGEQSLDRYLAISARGVPFNLAHAAGNVAIALAAGPALVRMLARFRTRFEVSWPDAARGRVAGRVGAASLLLAAVLGGAEMATPPEARGAGPSAARAWLERAQSADGGYASTPGTGSSPAMTGWAVLGLEAAGRNPLDVRNQGRTPIDYLRSQGDRLRSVGDLERTILALEAAGVDARSFAGRDLVAELRSRRSGDGSFQGQVNLTAFGILALRAAGVGSGELQHSRGWLRHAQNGDGGWGFRPGASSDPDSTGAALQGLAVAGGGSSAAVSYLRRVQRPDGGWGLNETGVTNSQSTAWAIQGLVAVGVNPSTVRAHGRSGVEYLAARQVADGHYRYSASTDQTPIWVTSQALLAVTREALPIEPVPRSAGAPSPQGDLGTTAAAGARSDPGAAGALSGDGRGRRGKAVRHGGGDRSPARVGGGEGAQGLAAVPLAAEADAEEAGGDGPGTGAYVAGGLGLLAASLAAGFVWYRRTLR